MQKDDSHPTDRHAFDVRDTDERYGGWLMGRLFKAVENEELERDIPTFTGLDKQTIQAYWTAP
jgi:hypothetical protein